MEAGWSEKAEQLLNLVASRPLGHLPPYLSAQLARFRAPRDALAGRDETVEADLRSAMSMLTALGYPYWVARAQQDLGRWLTDRHRDEDAAPLLQASADEFAGPGVHSGRQQVGGAVARSD